MTDKEERGPMSDYDVGQLRLKAQWCSGIKASGVNFFDIMTGAADAIEALQQECKELEHHDDLLSDWIERYLHVVGDAARMEERIKALQQRCEELDEERLEQMIQCEGKIYDIQERDQRIATLEAALEDLLCIAQGLAVSCRIGCIYPGDEMRLEDQLKRAEQRFAEVHSPTSSEGVEECPRRCTDGYDLVSREAYGFQGRDRLEHWKPCTDPFHSPTSAAEDREDIEDCDVCERPISFADHCEEPLCPLHGDHHGEGE